MSVSVRMESDLAGTLEVPQDAYYGIHSLRAAENFPITGQRIPDALIVNLARIKKACAMANASAGILDAEKTKAICSACDEVINGQLHDQFIVDRIQGGAGTSTNMNANEVIANRAIEILGGQKGDYSLVHPNDHVNCAQSTNDVYPTAIGMTLYETAGQLIKVLQDLIATFEERAATFDNVITLGRTQLQDAVPIRFGQVFSAYSAVMRREMRRLKMAQEEMLCINLGGTAIGTGLNASPAYLQHVVALLSDISGMALYRSENCVDATQNADRYVALSAAVKGCGASLSKICNDLRLLSSGPNGGFGDIVLPSRQNGSSIMPGKVNPVIPEVVNQIAFRLIGYDVTVTMAAEGGQLELNAFEPIIFDSLYNGCTYLAHGIETLNHNCIQGITINKEHCMKLLRQSPSLVTALSPYIGYKEACDLAKEAQKNHMDVEDLVIKRGLMSENEVEKAADFAAMTEGIPGQE
ncbi:MAG: aspartate ammonia-lyase [Clostridiales bacterium]|nr:aspartate ammonia-lyase [Clostridiales bacterium]